MNNCLNYCLLWVLLFGLSCSSNQQKVAEKGDRLLATVYNRSLFLSQVEEMIPTSSSKEDSTLFLNAFVERWVRENLMMHEAEKNLPQDLNIDQLVRDYRASLIQHNYEQILIELELDSVISSAELFEFYENNKDQYQLEAPIVRCYFIKIPLSVEGSGNLQKWWESNDQQDFIQMVDYCNRYATTHMLEDSVWYKLGDLEEAFPKGSNLRNSLRNRRSFVVQDEQFQYFFKRLELMSKEEIAPLSYIEDQASKAILHKRKLRLLEKKKEELYEMELGKNNVKIYAK